MVSQNSKQKLGSEELIHLPMQKVL